MGNETKTRVRQDSRPFIAHLIHRMALGGLEKGVVTVINRLPQYRHAVIAVTSVDRAFAKSIEDPTVELFELGKKSGRDFGMYVRLWRVLRRLRPHVLHSRNISSLELQFAAFWAGVPVRIHSEEGRDVHDLYGTNPRHRLIRRIAAPFVQEYIAVSADLQSWLVEAIRVPAERVHHIYNCVNTGRFFPGTVARETFDSGGVIDSRSFVIGSVGRMVAVKDHVTLVEAFISLLAIRPEWRAHVRLMIIGDGPNRAACLQKLECAGMRDLAWLPGERSDIPELMRAMDVFVLPSLGEGISYTILEAMATGVPVIATSVGGNVELVQEGTSGFLVPASSPAALSTAIGRYIDNPSLAREHGRSGRRIVDEGFTVDTMIHSYESVYEAALRQYGRNRA